MLRGDFPVISRQKNASIPPCQITLTYVELSPDLKYATVFFTLSDDLKKVEALTFFELQTSYFRSLIAKQMQLKFVPNLVFKIDESVEYAKKIEDLLKH
jgi:ribosome-binding factor A